MQFKAVQLTASAAWTAGSVLAWLQNPSLPRTRGGKGLVAAALVVVLGGGAGGYLWLGWGSLPDDAALRVGDRVVTVDELTDRIESLEALYSVQPPRGRPERMDEFRRSVAKSMAVDLVLERQAEQLEVTVSERDVRQVLSTYIDRAFGTGPAARDEFIRALGIDNTSERVVRAAMRRQLRNERLFTRVTREVTVTERELRAAFPRYEQRLSRPEMRRLRNIVVRSRARAQQVIQQLNSGTAFPAAAQQFSLDPATRNSGGDLGFVSRRQLLGGYGNAAFATPAGQVFGPVRNQFGWNVGTVVQVRPADPARYPEDKDRLRVLVEYNRRADVWRDWLGQALEQADVQYADDYRPAKPGALPAQGGSSPPGANPGAGRTVPDGRSPR